MLNDIKEYLKSNPNQLNRSRIDLPSFGGRLVNDDMAKYLMAEPTTWGEDLEPLAGHYDRRTTIRTPELAAGAYLVEANVAEGNSSRFVLWIADSVLVRKPLDGRILFFVADARDGQPLPGIDVEFFGYRNEQIGDGNHFRTLTSHHALPSDENGMVIPDACDLSPDYQWLNIARGEKGSFAFLDFQGVWTSQLDDAQYEATKSLVITDRPVYRPGHAMQFKVWVGHAKYDQEGPSPFAGSTVPVRIMDPAGTQLFERGFGGGMAGEEAETAEALPAWVEPTVRKNFLDTALWVGRLDTDATGRATVDLAMPENLTTWKIKVWGMGAGTRVGAGEVEVVTSKDLLIRLQAPRFFVERDEVVLSAVVHNYLATDKLVKVSLGLPDETLVPLDPTDVEVTVPAAGEMRVDWRVKVEREGEATIRMSALTDEESDAMELTFPVRIHGAPRMESWAGTVRPEAPSAGIDFTVPSERRVADTRLEVRYSPTLAGAMVDALPYLVDYPYGCTEQTLNRWLPTVVTQRVLLDMQVDLAAVAQHQTNLNAQEIGDDRERAAQWKRFDRNPVFDRDEVDRMVRDGLKKLAEMQVSDGGWGWFSGYGERSWPHTTAVVVHGLQVARDNDVALVPGLLEQGVDWLDRYREEQLVKLRNEAKGIDPRKKQADDLDALVHSILVDEGRDSAEMREFLYRDRNSLSVYSKALTALACHRVGDAEKLAMLRRNIEQFLVQDEEEADSRNRDYSRRPRPSGGDRSREVRARRVDGFLEGGQRRLDRSGTDHRQQERLRVPAV